jgi:hypothetical protein
VTDQEIERAARELCRLRGINPDGLDPWSIKLVYDRENPLTPSPVVSAPLPLWKSLVSEVVAWDQVRRAVESSGSDTGG